MRAFKALRGAALPACAAFGVLVPLCGVSAAGAETISQTFSYTGAEQTFTVPAGVFSVQVLAVGGSGGVRAGLVRHSFSVAGGAAAQVSGDLSVRPGETLYVEVGGNGQNRASGGSGFPSGGYNGGGNGGGGGGGGASDARTSPRASGLFPGNRLLVAAGGGGGGTYGLGSCIGGQAVPRASQDKDQTQKKVAAKTAADLPRRAAEAHLSPTHAAPARKVSSVSAVTEARRWPSILQPAVATVAGAVAATTAVAVVVAVMLMAAAGAGAAPVLVPVGGTVELASSEAQPQVQIVARHGHRQHRGG